MQIHKEDVIVVYHPVRNERVLGRVTKVETSKKETQVYFDVADESAAWDSTRESFSVPLASVFTNLGSEPRCYGKAYGVDIRPYNETTHVKGWGEVVWFLNTTDEMVNKTHDILKELVGMFKDDRLHPFAYYTAMHELELKKGKVNRGWYLFFPKKESDKIEYIINDQVGLDLHIAAHEYGHGCWHRLMSDKMRGEWVDIYAQSVEVLTCSDNTVISVIGDVAELKGKPIRSLFKQYKKDKEPEMATVLDVILKFIKQEHFLDRLQLDLLLAGGYSLKEYLPTFRDVKKGAPQLLVSEYGKKNAMELWAEAFSYYYSGQELPEEIEDLLRETLITLQASR